MGAFLSKLLDLCNPCSKMSFSSLLTHCIDHTFYELLDIMILAAGMEINVKQAIELEMERVFGKVVFGPSQYNIHVVDVVHLLCKRIGGFKVGIANMSVQLIIPTFRQKLSPQAFHEVHKHKCSEVQAVYSNPIPNTHIFQAR